MNHTVPRLGLLPMEVPSLHSVHPHMTMPGWVNLDMENLERAKKKYGLDFLRSISRKSVEKRKISSRAVVLPLQVYRPLYTRAGKLSRRDNPPTTLDMVLESNRR